MPHDHHHTADTATPVEVDRALGMWLAPRRAEAQLVAPIRQVLRTDRFETVFATSAMGSGDSPPPMTGDRRPATVRQETPPRMIAWTFDSGYRPTALR